MTEDRNGFIILKEKDVVVKKKKMVWYTTLCYQTKKWYLKFPVLHQLLIDVQKLRKYFNEIFFNLYVQTIQIMPDKCRYSKFLSFIALQNEKCNSI